MSLIERSRIILHEVKHRENQIKLNIKDENFQFVPNLKDAINQLENILATNADDNYLQVDSEFHSKITILLRRMILYSEVGDIVLESFPVIIFGLIEDIFKERLEYKDHEMFEATYISRYLYLVASLQDLPYFVDSFSLFWCKDQDRKRELFILLENIFDLFSKLPNIQEISKEEVLNQVRDLVTINLLWERVAPIRDYLKVNSKLYEIIHGFIFNISNYKELNQTIKYLFLRLYSNLAHFSEEDKILLYKENGLEHLFISIQISQEYIHQDQIDLYLQYFIFKKPHLNAFKLVFSKSNFNFSSQSLNNDSIQNHTNIHQSSIFEIYDQQVIIHLKELILSSILAKNSLIFLENINNGLQIYYHLIHQIKIHHFDDKHPFKIIRLYLDNTIDSKSLLGQWTVGDQPGEFKWEYGILSQSIINGDWLLIENIQDAPKDVIIKLNEISENICQPLVNKCNITQTKTLKSHYFELTEFNRKIQVHPNFRIFASCVYLKSNNTFNNSTNSDITNHCIQDHQNMEIFNYKDYINMEILRLINKDKWNICKIPTPTNYELKRGIDTHFKNLSLIKEELLNSYTNLVNFMNNPNSFFLTTITKSFNTRRPSCCDFFKACQSISRLCFSNNNNNYTYLNEKLKMKISILFGNVLLDHIPLKSYRNRCQTEISKSFGIHYKESEYYLKNCKFDIHFLNNIKQSRNNHSCISIINKELDIDFNINLIEKTLNSSTDISSSRLLLKTNHHHHHDQNLNYTFTSIHSKIIFKVIMSIYNNENVLLVGDTGTGKTTIIQQLHYMLYGNSKKYINDHLKENEDKFCELLVYNFNDQSESSDIIGSFKPVNIYNEVKLLYDDYLVLLERSNISRKKNETIINYLLLLLRERKWLKFINNLIIIIDKLLVEFENILKNQSNKEEEVDSKIQVSKDSKKDKKRTAVNIEDIWTLRIYWNDLKQKCVTKLKDERIMNSENERQKHYFEFLDGILLKAIKQGHWLILDEINLASIDILQRLIPILNRRSNYKNSEIQVIDNNSNSSEKMEKTEESDQINDFDYIIVPEKGNEMIKIHPRFRLFSCMNPVIVPIELKENFDTRNKKEEDNDESSQQIQIKSTTGKKDLPQIIRALFTEYYVDELIDRKDLEDVAYNYLKDVLLTNQINISTLVEIYLELKKLSNRHEITVGLEGNGHGIPNFSLRTFSNCLSYIRTILKLQSNWRRNQNQLKLIEDFNAKDNVGIKSGNSILQNSILRQEISEIVHNGIMMSFATPLVSESYNKVDKLIRRMLKMTGSESSKRNMNCVLFSAPRLSSSSKLGQTALSGKASYHNYILITDYVVRMGNYNKNFKLSENINNEFVITPYVEQNLRKILRILSGSRNPILIEGETSTGKTSLIKYISELTNHKFVRINNHEHTDTEEYFGKFIPNHHGELEFVEGPLINSIRNGYWLVLDELNLAPSEVLESLNRLLDNNREIYIPETGETVEAHEDFMLFATQNPAGSIYGGRKVLSQAFRNRFVEIYLDEIPSKELEMIISKRSKIPSSYSELMVKVFTELKRHRSKSQMFSGDLSFVTVRDLLRWGNRLFNGQNNTLDKKNLVIQGFYVIGERIRETEEKYQLAEILYKICKPFEIKSIEEIINYSTCHINNLMQDRNDERIKKKRRKEEDEGINNTDMNSKISLDGFSNSDKNLKSLKDLINKSGEYILTDSFKRMLTLVNDCIVFNEPAILVGSTGCGKTSIFQLLSTLYKKQLYIVNCHQQIEASDMLGSLRPIRSKILRLSQELNNFKIELLGANGREEESQQEGNLVIINILNRVEKIIKLLEESGSSNREGIHFELNALMVLLESGLKELEKENSSFEVCLLLENMFNELKSYQNKEFEKDQGLFEWQDGPIIKAMKTGSFLLLDEINLCDDSVIERLNSLLEDHYIQSKSGLTYKSRVIYLTEKGGANSLKGENEDYIIHSHKDFRIFATMNPGGDYGKRELSPALRNRFNEIFVPTLSIYQLRDDIEFLIFRNISKLSNEKISKTNMKMLSKCIIVFSILYENEIKNDEILHIQKLNNNNNNKEFFDYFKLMIENGIKLFKGANGQKMINFSIDSGNISDVKEYTIRDILSWCQFICNNFQEILNFYDSNRNDVIDSIIENENKPEFTNLNYIKDDKSLQDLILIILVLGELFIQGAGMLILDGLSEQNNDENDLIKENNLYLIYMERLIEIFNLYLIIPSLQENGGIVGKLVKEVLNYRFLRNQGNNWIKVGGGKVLKNETPHQRYLLIDQDTLKLGPFQIKRKLNSSCSNSLLNIDQVLKRFTFDSKTTLRNLSSIIRSMSILKPILLEGAPGIGKTAIILTLSKLVGVKLHRINMSEQTDFSDLFGCEVPNNNNNNHQLINWIDGVLLYAMKNGDWVILDELNLATQQILEGLNSVMDHRRNIYIPEIGQTILCHENFRIFATQNPVKVGSSGRKGLPQSFLNRFVRISVGKLNYNDYLVICNSIFLDQNTCNHLTQEVILICIEITREIEVFSNHTSKKLKDSSLWEWNLRDIIRLLRFVQLYLARNLELNEIFINQIYSIYYSFETVYLLRLRTKQDYDIIKEIILNRLIQKMNQQGVDQDKINNTIENIMNPSFISYNNTSCIHKNIKDLINFRDYLKTYIFKDFNELNNSIGMVGDYLFDLDLNILPINSKKRIISIIDSILLGENIILTCNNADQIEDVILSIESISKNYFQNIKVNQVNILPSIDANDLIGGYQQYNQENIMNQVLDLVSSLRIEYIDNKFGAKKLNLMELSSKLIIQRIDENNFEFELKNYLDLLRNDINIKTISPIGIVEEIESKLQSLELIKKNGLSENNGPKFQFTFSTLINSIKNGEWLIITNIQNCSSALLDRLNSLLEDKENDLFIIESGIPQYIKRHENFRLFFVNDYNIQNKFISNALINRCIDIFIGDESTNEGISDVLKEEDDKVKTEKVKTEENLQIKSQEDCLREILLQILQEFNSFNHNFNFGCEECIEEIIMIIVSGNKSYNRQVMDFVKIYSNDFQSFACKNYISSLAIYLVSIIINGMNNFLLESRIKRRTRRIASEKVDYLNILHSNSGNCLCVGEENNNNNIIQIMEILGKSENGFFINWMRNLLFSAIANNNSVLPSNSGKSQMFKVIEDSMIKTFHQFGLVPDFFTNINKSNSKSHQFSDFYLVILKAVENWIFNNIEKQKEDNSRDFYYLFISKMVPRTINPIFKEAMIKKYDHIHEQYRELVMILLRNLKNQYWKDLLDIRNLFLVYLRDIFESGNINENLIYLNNLMHEIIKAGDYIINNENIKIKILYVKSILKLISQLFGIDLIQNDNNNNENENSKILINSLRNYIPNGDLQILTNIFSLILNPIMVINEKDLIENVLKLTNIFSYTLNCLGFEQNQQDLRILIKQYINKNNKIKLSFQENQSLNILLENCEYFNINYVKQQIEEYIIKILLNFENSEKMKILDILQLFELIENNILILNDDIENMKIENKLKLTPNELIQIFETRIKNGISLNIFKLIKMKIINKDFIKDESFKNTIMIKMVPRNIKYLQAIYESEISYLGNIVITNKENFNIQTFFNDSLNTLKFLINKKMSVENLLKYFTQSYLCNLEFLDSILEVGNDRNAIWKELINQIEGFNKEMAELKALENLNQDDNNQQIVESSSRFFEYYIMKQFVRTQFELYLIQKQINRQDLIGYLNYLKGLILSKNSNHIIGIMLQIIKLLSINDSYTIYLDYLSKKRANNSFKEFEKVEKMKRNHLMASLLDLQVVYNFEIEHQFKLGKEILQENSLIDVIKNGNYYYYSNSNSNNNKEQVDLFLQNDLGVNFEHIFKLMMKFDTGMIRVLFLNYIYHGLFNFKFHQVINLKSEYLSLFYYLNNQEIIPNLNSLSKNRFGGNFGKKGTHILLMTGYFIKVIFDFLNFTNIINNKTRVEEIDLQEFVQVLLISKSISNDNISGKGEEEVVILIQSAIQSIKMASKNEDFNHLKTLLVIIEEYFEFINYHYNTVLKNLKDDESLSISNFEILIRTCLVVISLPVYYHCRNLFYIDENQVYDEYERSISKDQKSIDSIVKSRYLSYFHHFNAEKRELKGLNALDFDPELQILRKIDKDTDDRKEFVVFKTQEIISQILENDLIKEITASIHDNHFKQFSSSLGKLENFIIMVQNILSKNNTELFQQELSYLYNDVLVPLRFLLNSLLYGIVGITFYNKQGNLSKTSNLLENSQKQNFENLNVILDNFEYEYIYLGLLPISSSSQSCFTTDETFTSGKICHQNALIDLWRSLLKVGNYIHEYNTEFLSLYNKFYQDFEYNVQKTYEKLSSGNNREQVEQEDDEFEIEFDFERDTHNFINENQLIYKNDNIDRFIEKNHILNEFDLMNELINNQSNYDSVSASETGIKYTNIKYICLKILEVIILRFENDQGFKNESVGKSSQEIITGQENNHHQMKRYIYYNLTYNHSQGSQNNIWRFILIHLNHHKIFTQDFGLENGSYYQHIKVHIDNLTFNKLVNNSNNSATTTILKSCELSCIIEFTEKLQLIEKLLEILTQVEKLLIEYQNQPILIMIKDIVEKILNMDIHKFNIITLICYLDVLLIRIIKWHEYIKQGFNLNININNAILKQSIDFIKYSIYEFRKLQINSWFNLVFKIFQKYNYMASFSFGNILIIISKILTEYQQKGFNHNLLYHEILNYLKNSTKGEYPIRFLFLRYISDLIFNILNSIKTSSYFNGIFSQVYNKENGQIINLIKINKIIISILNFGEIIYQEILKDNQKLLKDVKNEISDIIKLSMWEVKDYNKIKKNIHNIQKQLKKSLLRFDEKLMIRVGLPTNITISDHSIMENVLPKLNEFILKSQLKGEEGIGYIIRILSDSNNNDKMLKQRYYKTLIDLDTYNLEKLSNVNNFKDFYYNNLDQYINNQHNYIKISKYYKDENNEKLSYCFIILDQLRMNEENKYNFENITQSLINYNKLLSIGNTLLYKLINDYNEFQMNYNFNWLVNNYLLNINSSFYILNDNKLRLREYFNNLLKISDHLELIKILLFSSNDHKSTISNNNINNSLEFLVKDKLKNDKKNHQKITLNIDRIINNGLMKMISKLRNTFYISELMNYYSGKDGESGNDKDNEYCILIGLELILKIKELNLWIKKEMNELTQIIHLNFVNNGIFELNIIHSIIENLDLSLSNIFNIVNNSVEELELELKDLQNLNDLLDLFKQDKFHGKIFRLKNNKSELDELKSKFVLEYNLRFENLKMLSETTLEYIQGLYLLLENDFFNLCEKKAEEEEGEAGSGDRDPNIDWKSGCGFGNREDNDFESKDISKDLNNDDSLLEGLKGEDENQIQEDDDKKKKKNDAVDTELDFNSRLEDFEDDENDDKQDKDQKDDFDDENQQDHEKIFDKVDLENKNSRIEDVQNEDLDQDKDDDDDDDSNEKEDEKKKENIETKNKNEDENNDNSRKETDIVAKVGNNSEEELEEDDDDKRKKEEKENLLDVDNNEDKEDDEHGKDEINSIESDLDELFEYDAKSINPNTNNEEVDKEDQGEGEGENNDNDSEMIGEEIDDNMTISDMDEDSKDNEGFGGEESDSNDGDNYQFGDEIGENEEEKEEEDDHEMKVDKYQSLGQNGTDMDMKQENEKEEQNHKQNEQVEKDRNSDSKNNLNKGKHGLKVLEEEKEEEKEAENKDKDKDNMIDETKQEEVEDNGIENSNGDDNGKENEFGSNKEKDEIKEEELMNPLLEENSENIKDWFKSLKDIIIKDEEDNENNTEEIEMSDNHSNFKIDKDLNSRSEMVQNLPSFGNEGSSSNIDLGEEKNSNEKKDLKSEIMKQEIENNHQQSIENSGNDINDNVNKKDSNKLRNMLKEQFNESKDLLLEKDENDNDDSNNGNGSDDYDKSNVFECNENKNGDNGRESEEMNKELDNNLSKIKKQNNSILENMEIWNKIQSEITPIVNLLSNQLRIILEPTIRGKMEGGFKTGKKLSMKKVITYIASDYRKDKIWLRRSKPSKREFNILMCIDNSQSMSVSNNEYMALQSLFIIIQSLQKIEVGNFGVCSFTGENIKQLIEMTSQINNNDAINLLNYFNFSEETLDSHQNSIPNILEYSTNLLKDFSNSSNNNNNINGKQCHQLIIIITDGRFNKSKVNSWINYAIQNNCIPVLIIIDNIKDNDKDNKTSTSSIFKMKSVNKDENGKMIITPYLENFPFSYYSIIQDPKKLPNVLCELIKQWFELICN